jgi:predicted GNAT superfamily acetyltransferase
VTEILIRHLQGLGEYIQAVSFQEETWGVGFSERVPKSLMKVTQRLGGVVGGAFDSRGEMVGFVYGVTGLEHGRAVHWSDILAVSPGLRDHGVGRRLKLFQREAVLELGVTRMYWTFDPLESRNAYLNMGKLGAVAREYEPDMYGVSDSPLHRGLGTDRFVATWELDSERVRGRLGGARPPGVEDVRHLPLAFQVSPGGETGSPDPTASPGRTPESVLAAGMAAGGLRVPIPASVQGVRDQDPGSAAAWRDATRAILHPAIGLGWEVRELVRAGEVSYYVLVPPGGG